MTQTEINNKAKSEVYYFHLYDIFMRNDDIIQLQIYEGFYGELEDGKNIVKTFEKLKGKEKCLVLIVAPENGSFTKENREYVASEEVSKIVKADAFVIRSLGVKLLMNGYLRINKPNRPTRFFNSENSAVEWLKKVR